MGHSRGCFDGGHSDGQRSWKNLEGEVMSQSPGLDTVSQRDPWVPLGELRALGTWHRKGVKIGVLKKEEKLF